MYVEKYLLKLNLSNGKFQLENEFALYMNGIFIGVANFKGVNQYKDHNSILAKLTNLTANLIKLQVLTLQHIQQS